MNSLALERLHAAGWTNDRKVDIRSIEKKYASARVALPDKLKEFFTSFGFLKLTYKLNPDSKSDDYERHSITPSFGYSKTQLAHMFEPYDIHGMAYPVGCAFRENMEIFYHDGNFYVFMGGGPLIRCGNSVEGFFNGLIVRIRTKVNALNERTILDRDERFSLAVILTFHL